MFRIALAILLFWSQAVLAGSMPLTMAGPTGAGVAYTGPGDIVSGAAAWYGLRCYSAAKASLAKAINVRRASDNTSQDIGLTAACALDVQGVSK